LAGKLGSIKRLDVRTVWTKEASEFTPWLAKDENIAKLSQAIGIELEVENTEVPVGPYNADILARDSATGQYVVIENQLERIDHDHLGKAIVYASVLDAAAVVWIAREFTEEHSKAIDWLNDNSTEDVSFYGVRLELWQIDDSKPAVQFNVVTRSSEIFRKAVITKTTENLTEVKRLQLEFWTRFRDALAETKQLPSVQEPRPRYWYNVPIGRAGIHLSNIMDTWGNRFGIRLYMRHRRGGQEALEQLIDQKAQIEAELGESLKWDSNPDAKDKVITLERKADVRNRAKWDENVKWMVEKTLAMRKVFENRVKKLKLNIERGQEEETR
jgi:hypothetical protein